MKSTYTKTLSEIPKDKLIDALATIRDIIRPIDPEATEGPLDKIWGVLEFEVVKGQAAHDDTGDYNSLV